MTMILSNPDSLFEGQCDPPPLKHMIPEGKKGFCQEDGEELGNGMGVWVCDGQCLAH